ncbi:hypothetical protein [Microbispora sp. NPDC049125]|uniref:hypothetical protein n=1 Tax=Microbispora sp. NPDC049125 TaxID=3154929 RepID=UPI0034650CDD
MTGFRQALGEIAEQGPPVGGMAERAIARARRRRLGLFAAPGATVTAALVSVIVLVANGVLSGGGEREGTMRLGATQTVTSMGRTPEPLPARGVPAVMMAYTVTCPGAGPRWQACSQWRLVTTDMRQFRVDDAIAPEVRDGSLEHQGALAVAADGRRVAYFRSDGRFVIRDLARGGVESPFAVKRADLREVTAHIAWSPDGRRLSVSFDPADDDRPTTLAARLVDLKTMATVTLPLHCCVLGLPAGDAPIPMYDAYATEVGRGSLLLVGDDGAVRRRLPIGEIERSSVFSRHPGNTAVAADGTRLAALLWPDRPPDDRGHHVYVPELTTFDVARGAMTRRHALPRFQQVMGEAELLGWRDAATVLVGMRYERRGVYRVNADTGETHQVVGLTAQPERLSVAYGLL